MATGVRTGLCWNWSLMLRWKYSSSVWEFFLMLMEVAGGERAEAEEGRHEEVQEAQRLDAKAAIVVVVVVVVVAVVAVVVVVAAA